MFSLKFAKAILKALPRNHQRRLHDRIEDLRRRRPAPHRGLEQFGLARTQVYPEGINFDDCVRVGMAEQLKGLVIRRETPVASIGSCFADEFASHMRGTGFNYLVAESDVFPASANWGRVYTIPCLRQIVMYSTADDFAIPIEHSPDGWFDPLREQAIGLFPTRDQAEAAIRSHRAASRRAFANARVLIVTLGQNEAWIDRQSGFVWAQRPPSAILETDRERFEAKVFSFEEDTSWLEDLLMRLRGLNKELDVLLTVSPVASYATFCGTEVVTQSFAGKCVLRAVAERITHLMPRVWYFPSFEMALGYNPHTLRADNRHVKNSTVDRILNLLHETVVR
ncbi:MAG TPA: GSCFA domain-containing protein [Pyrinomonadaceae bacterium]|nr:GSCFA domain-containing protein [Pyrinomonadaceae bacterium]